MADSDTNYGTVAGFRTYFTARGTDVSAYSDDAAVLAALTVASSWLDARYRDGFPGWKVGLRPQILEWPRVGGLDIYGYSIDQSAPPLEVQNATYEAALRQLQSPGSLSKDFTPNKYEQARVEGAVNVKYVQYTAASDVQTQLAIVDQILAPILTGGVSNSLSGCVSR
jgi:hypothetical protein